MMGEKVVAVVPAAGTGRRMNTPVSKQYLPLGESTVIETTLNILLNHPVIERVIVGVDQSDDHWSELKIAAHSRIETVNGGAERAGTVLNCLNHIAENTRNDPWVMVHDAARPCVLHDDIDALYNTAVNDPVGALLASPLVDTIKQVANNTIEATLDRQLLWAAQTPQMFKCKILRKALLAAQQQQMTITDEAAAMESINLFPRVVKSSSRNIKITHPDDLPLANFYLQQMSENTR